MTRLARAFGLALLLLAVVPSVNSQAKYDPGVSDGEIRLGQTAPYSGPVSAYGTFGRERIDELLALLAELENALADPPARKDSRRKQQS